MNRGGLAGAVRPEEAVDLAGLHAQVDSVNRARPLLELAYQLLRFDRGAGHTPSLPTALRTAAISGAPVGRGLGELLAYTDSSSPSPHRPTPSTAAVDAAARGSACWR